MPHPQTRKTRTPRTQCPVCHQACLRHCITLKENELGVLAWLCPIPALCALGEGRGRGDKLGSSLLVGVCELRFWIWGLRLVSGGFAFQNATGAGEWKGTEGDGKDQQSWEQSQTWSHRKRRTRE